MSQRNLPFVSLRIDSSVIVPNPSSFGQISQHGGLEVVDIPGGEARQAVRLKVGRVEQMSSIPAAEEEV